MVPLGSSVVSGSLVGGLVEDESFLTLFNSKVQHVSEKITTK